MKHETMKTDAAFKIALVVAATMLSAMTLVGCHTVAGAGQDVRHVGNRITQGANALHP